VKQKNRKVSLGRRGLIERVRESVITRKGGASRIRRFVKGLWGRKILREEGGGTEKVKRTEKIHSLHANAPNRKLDSKKGTELKKKGVNKRQR